MTSSTTIGRETFVLMPRRRTFLGGVSELLDFSEVQRRFATSATEKEADARALAADWRAVGKDIELAYVWGKQQIAR
ncbi:MAG: hypothetical protein KGI78_01675 [Patescibacteria group bacterium]|nr:hypothetical protein [Patescibacteria group bacterium]MDE1943965.1 hypothetical protein [Patescibacteria group bacterium]MDE1944944.1 hypothetical protein [Patescibacteria group bacterium]MDE2057544.1 hypothetical protein [Patescibacteria group bacterium]